MSVERRKTLEVLLRLPEGDPLQTHTVSFKLAIFILLHSVI